LVRLHGDFSCLLFQSLRHQVFGPAPDKQGGIISEGFSASKHPRNPLRDHPSNPRKIRDEKCCHHAFALRSAQSETHSQIENLYYQGRSIAARCIPHILYAVVENLSALES
jgi:hypothetical protein